MRPVAVRPVIEAALESVRAGAEARQIVLDADFEAAEAEVDGDPVRLQQIVWNLLSNAVKFTPDGGHVHVALRHDNGLVLVTVHDDGRGIPLDLLPQIFQRFRQADASNTRAQGGLGLGLAIVRHLVEMHGGTIEAASDGPGAGSLFTVRLPVRASPTDSPARASVGVVTPMPVRFSGPLLEGLFLLVVDDDPGARELLVTTLENEGARVTPAGSVGEALAVLGRERPDVLVSDISMPGDDGYALARRLRRIERGRRRIRALALTAHARPEDTEQAILAGFDAHVAKPIDPVELALQIARLVGRAAPGIGRVADRPPDALGA